MPLPDDAAQAVAAIVSEVRSAELPTGARDVRWVRLDGLHLTLRFLGPTPEDRVDAAAEAVLVTARRASGPIRLELAGAGTFPRPGRPRTLWIGIGGDTEALATLASQMDSALVGAGWAAEERPFRAHLTLARSDGVAVGPLVAGRLTAAMAGRVIPCAVDQVGLYESLTGGGPARYVPLSLANLGSSAANGMPVYHQTSPDPP